MVEHEQVISFLKQKGPSVPNDMKRTLGGDSMFFGAMLSELKSRGKVSITNIKLGTSPFYYLPGQEAQLEKLVQYANPKDQKTIAMLKEKKVVRDQTLELFERVSLRNVKDFAKELHVNTASGKMMFWRYYLVSEPQAIEILKEQYNKPQAQVVPTPVPTSPVETPKVEPQKAEVVPEPPVKATIVSSEADLEKIKEESVKKTPEPLKQSSSPSQKKHEETTHQQQLSSPPSFESTEFYQDIISYFKDAEITIKSQDQVAKNREYDFVVTVPSAVGSMDMYCRARNKKKLNEGDVAPALLKAKTKDLPCLFLTNGEFTKKALEIIKKEYKGILIKKL